MFNKHDIEGKEAQDVENTNNELKKIDQTENKNIESELSEKNTIEANKKPLESEASKTIKEDDIKKEADKIEQDFKNAIKQNNEQDLLNSETQKSDLKNNDIEEKEIHIIDTGDREAFEKKFYEIASEETSWNTPEMRECFLNTVDIYAERAVNDKAVETKDDFYVQYVNRDYHYPSEYIEKIKEPFLSTGASSIVNKNAVINAFDVYGTVGRGTDGNFVTSIADDSKLCFDGEKIKDAETIAMVKGVESNTYVTGMYQYEYDAEMVNSCNELQLLHPPNGDTCGASSLNIPGCKTWAGEDINNSESELIMPSVICDDYDSTQVFSDISEKGCFEIYNPTVLTQNGNEIQVDGCFRVKEI